MAKLDRVAVWNRADGGVSITHFDTLDMLEGETEDLFIERVLAKHSNAPQLQGVTPTLISSSEIPATKTNRNEWAFKSGKVVVDSAKLQAKLDKAVEKKAKRDAVLAKLKITEEDLANIIKG